MKKLGGSLNTSEVQFSFMNLICYFLLMVGKDEFMFINLQLLQSGIDITVAARSIGVIDTMDCILPYAKKDVLCPALRAFYCLMLGVKRSFLKPHRTSIFLKQLSSLYFS